MSGFLCSMVGASFTVAAVAQVLRSKKGITAIGNAQVSTAQSKFGGASALFDGTGDYLLVSPASDFAFGTGDFTVEFFVRFSTLSVTNILYDYRPSGGTNFLLFLNASNTIIFNNGSERISVGQSLSTGVWYHYAITRSGTSTKLFRDGTQIGSTYTDSTNYTGGSGDLRLGWNSVTGQFAAFLNGHMDEIRISNTARYTANFTAPTTPFVNDSNTVLLIHADGTDASTVFRDDNGAREQKGISANGNAQVSTAQSKFGGASALFDGSGDYLSLGANSVTNDLALTSTTWTVEYWARITSHIGQFQATVAIWNDQTGVGNVYYFSTNMFNTTNKMGFEYVYGTNSGSGNLTFGSSTLATGVWQHHAFVRNGNTLTAYLDGVSQGTHDMTGRTIDITGFNNSGANSVPVTIGGMSTGSGSFNGYLDEVRISNIARYTAAFTPSTTPFQSDANTVLLLHMDGTDASTTFTDDNGIAPYTP
jgi:hypothetical protein